MWKKTLVKIILRVVLIFATSVILTLLAMTILHHLTTIGTWTPKDNPLHRYFVNFKIILPTLHSIKLIYWYMVGVLALESVLALIFKKPLLIITDTTVFTGLENGILEEILALLRLETRDD